MKIKLTNNEIINLFNIISALQISGSAKFAYTLAKNRELLGRQVKILQDTDSAFYEKRPRIKDYQKDLKDIVEKFATDPQGKPARPVNGQIMIPADKMERFLAEKNEVDKLYPDVVIAMEGHAQDMDALMREKTELELRSIDIGAFPKDVPQAAMNALYVLVTEEDNSGGRVTPLRPVPNRGPGTDNKDPNK